MLLWDQQEVERQRKCQCNKVQALFILYNVANIKLDQLE